MAPIKNTSQAWTTGKFFVGIGVVVVIVLFLLDPRATITSPGVVLISIGLVLMAIGWFRHPGRRWHR